MNTFTLKKTEVVYGPRSHGGREIMDLRLEQPILHLKATVSHIRRCHNVGSAMIITLNNMQAEIRTHVPFYNLDPTLYNYGDQNARWRYTWDINYRYNINMTLKKLVPNEHL